MARLPNPVIQEIAVEPPGDLQDRVKSFYRIIGQAIRKAALADKKGEEKRKD